MRLLFSLIVITLLTACTTKQEHESTLSSWVGSEESSLIASWGPPTSFYESGDIKYLTWGHSSSTLVGGTAPSYTTTVIGNIATTQSHGGTAPILVNQNCDITMIIKSGRVDSWTYRGNNCYDF